MCAILGTENNCCDCELVYFSRIGDMRHILPCSIPYHAEVEGIECLRTVKRDDPDIVVCAEENVIAHVRRVISLSHLGRRAQ